MGLKTTPDQKQERLEINPRQKAAAMGEQRSLGGKAAVRLTDFCANTCVLAELEPTGYIIFYPAAGKYVEYSDTAASPYESAQGALICGGPGEYYWKDERGVYHHTLDETRTISPDRMEPFVSSSELPVARWNRIPMKKSPLTLTEGPPYSLRPPIPPTITPQNQITYLI